MYIVPSSTVNLYRGRVVAFSSKAKQTAYFQKKLARSAVPCTYVRCPGEVRLEVPLSVAKNCNYSKISSPDYTEFEEMYNVYHNLGGNGTATKWFNKIKELEIDD